MYGFCPVQSVDGYASAVIMLDGTTADSGEITFDTNSYHFYRNGIDITNQMSQAEKANSFSGFDRTKDNVRAYNEQQLVKTGKIPPPTGSGSTTKLFFEQIFTDPLGAPIDALDKGIKKVGQSTGVQTIVTVGAVALVFYIYKTITR